MGTGAGGSVGAARLAPPRPAGRVAAERDADAPPEPLAANQS